MTATISAYVGLQLLNTGPSAAPSSISFFMPFSCCELPMSRVARRPSLVLSMVVSQNTGSSIWMPNNKIIPPDTTAQTEAGTPRSAVVDFSKSVKTKIDSTRLVIIVRGCRSVIGPRLFPWSDPPPITTGRSGRVHGASTVKIPATNDNKYTSITEEARA